MQAGTAQARRTDCILTRSLPGTPLNAAANGCSWQFAGSVSRWKVPLARINRRHCAQIVPGIAAGGDLSDSVDFEISNLRVSNTRLRFAPAPAIEDIQLHRDHRRNFCANCADDDSGGGIISFALLSLAPIIWITCERLRAFGEPERSK